MTFKDFFRSATMPAFYVCIVIVCAFVLWLMVDANASVPNSSQIGGVTAGIALFGTLAAVSLGTNWWLTNY